MTLTAALSLFAIMLALAAVPSASVALVVARSATHGFRSGAAAAAGIVAADLVFVALAVLGMSFLAEALGAVFAILKYLGAAYLIWIGIGLIRSSKQLELPTADLSPGNLATSFAAGFFLTFGDLKAILFYASLFPAFVDLDSLRPTDLAGIALVTVLTVGGVKLLYAWAARAIVARLRSSQANRAARAAAGTLVLGAGAYLIAKS